MIFNETERVKQAWHFYDELLENKINRIAELAGVDRSCMIKINPAEFIEKNKYQKIENYKYQKINQWIAAHKTDDVYLISPLDADHETAAQIGYKSHVGVQKKLRASKCDVIPVSKDIALDFCVRNHRQTLPMISAAAVYLGLLHENELVAIMGYDTTSGAVRGKKEGYELVRLAIAKGMQIYGGASKLQTACENILRKMGIKKIFSYSNATINNGVVYKQLGFIDAGLHDGQPFVIMRDHRLIRLANLHPYSTHEELALRHQFTSRVGGNRMWRKTI